MKLVFALSADYGYINQITTLVKSILYYNHPATIYVINNDIPQEWFSNINNHVKPLHSIVVNKKVNIERLSEEHVSQPQINALSYGRILIPELIPEDRVLYIDSDAVVNDSLTELFNIDLAEHPIAAVEDVIYSGDFNSGVILFNNKWLRIHEPHIVEKMLEAGKNDQLVEGDQSVLNGFFNHRYLQLQPDYNYVIGYDFTNFYYPGSAPRFNESLAKVKRPKIIHYTGPSKPWLALSSGRLREKWWQYHNLDWSDIVLQEPLISTLDYQPDGSLFTFTADESLEQVDELIHALPNFTFNIAAWTTMGWGLQRLQEYPNVHLYPSIVGPQIDQLRQQSTAYLDINYGGKENNIMKSFLDEQIPVLSFSGALENQIDDPNFIVYDDNQRDELVAKVQELARKAKE